MLGSRIMIKNLSDLQNSSRHVIFSKRLTDALRLKNIEPKPITFATAFNKEHKSIHLKPHTVRKWLLGRTQPRAETLLLIANWLQVEPDSLFDSKNIYADSKRKIEFDFSDREIIAKYLSMNAKQKAAIKLIVDSMTNTNDLC